jgi:hypothetical protein
VLELLSPPTFRRTFLSRRGPVVVLVWVLVLLPLTACGGSNESDPPASSRETQEASPEESREFEFADYDYTHVGRKDCQKPERIGSKRSVTMVTPEIIGAAVFVPDCLIDVKRNKISVTVVNKSSSLHNLIVEGNDFELLVQPKSRESVEVDLNRQAQIAFACTIHPRFMFGAIFR